jgi:uncharacterized protein
MRIVVLGATGPTGRLVITEALRRGHHVTALARRPDALTVQEGLEVRRADVHEPDTVLAATTDADALISALGTAKQAPTTLTAGARAVAEAELPRVAWMGSFGVGESRRYSGALYEFIQRRVLGPGFDDKVAADEIVAGPRTTIVHPGMLTNGPATGHASVLPLGSLDRSWRFLPPKVTRADVAAALVREIEEPAHAGRTVAVL